MKLTDISNDINEWFDGSGPLSDIVISSRVRLARNLAGHKFFSKCSADEKQEILEKLKGVILPLDIGDEIAYINIDQTDELKKNFLIERHLISRNHAFSTGPRGVIIAHREFFTAMINEEDHLRLQVLKAGSQLEECFDLINKIDDMIENKVDYAFSEKYGYLTACPTNLGTGIRVSVMLHLPALKMTGHIEQFLKATKTMKLAVRGLFGEGTQAIGDFYQLSNQVTLGISEKGIIAKFKNEIIPEIVEYEEAARKQLLSKNADLLDDKISRAMALLKNAKLISSQEALLLLSHIRLGLNMHNKLGASTPAINELYRNSRNQEFENPISVKMINRLFMLTLPAHLQLNCGKVLDPAHRDILRAEIIRKALNQQS
ncbi:MAG TPA: protein arginine kinase [Sedimentisphaerales bacterium]|nr:protein arginine kinase [Sedimentisphaerales bacterium]